MNASKTLPSIYYSILGFAVFLAWLLVSLQYFSMLITNPIAKFISLSFAKHALYWKPYTISSFIFGLFLYSKYKNRLKNLFLSNKTIFLFIGILILIIASISFYTKYTLVELPFYWHTNQHYIGNALIPFIYGLIVLLIGVWAAKNKWLNEYHFFYDELKVVFKYSLALFVFWFLLKTFKIYSFITNGIIGEIIYMIDALTINLLLVFIYLFGLIFLENYRLGKKLLGGLEWLGRYWYVSAILLTVVLFVINTV